jgi:hypothetical protein
MQATPWSVLSLAPRPGWPATTSPGELCRARSATRVGRGVVVLGFDSASNFGSQPASEEQDAQIHRHGNLTLLANSLNSIVSNGPWSGGQGNVRRGTRRRV